MKNYSLHNSVPSNIKHHSRKLTNFQHYNSQVCQNWLEGHEMKSLSPKDIRQYIKIVILLQDILEILKKIEVKLQRVQSPNLEVDQAVDNTKFDYQNIYVTRQKIKMPVQIKESLFSPTV